MINSNLIIPLPPDSTGEQHDGRTCPAVGLIACTGDNCGEYALLKINKQGKFYADCRRGEITVNGCKGSIKGDCTGQPQTYEAYQSQLTLLGDAFPVPDMYKRYLENAWNTYLEKQEASDEITDATPVE